MQKLREDEELRDFLVKLTERYLDQESPLSRVDLLQTSLVQNDDGVKALQELRSLMKVSCLIILRLLADEGMSLKSCLWFV